MNKTLIKKTSIEGLYIIKKDTFIDERGFFREVFHLDELEKEIGKKFEFKQMNHSRSFPRVLRAIHAENWDKLVYPVNGKMFTAVADIRPQSETFGKIETFNFSDNDRKALFISSGLANSICVDGDIPIDYIYLVDVYYDGTDTRAIAWDDPDLNIQWPIKDPILSERDKSNPTLRELFPEKFR